MHCTLLAYKCARGIFNILYNDVVTASRYSRRAQKKKSGQVQKLNTMAKSGSVAKAAGKSRAKRNAVADALEDATLDADSRQSAHDEEAVLDGGDEEGDPPPPPRTLAVRGQTVTRATVAGNDAGAPDEVLQLRVQKRTKERDEAEKERDAAIKEAELLKRKIAELEAASKV